MKFTELIKKYSLSFYFTGLLLILEAVLSILFPLFIGLAVDDAIHSNYKGAFLLGVLGIISLGIGTGRRLYDSRFYAKIFQEIGSKTISQLKTQDVSTKSARLGMIREVIDFFENGIPELLNSIIGLIGTLIILFTLNIYVFYLSLIISAIVLLIYWGSRSKTIQLNSAFNDEPERQVIVLSQNEEKELSNHLKKTMDWNIKLSDLEAKNFSMSWVSLIAFLVLSIVIASSTGNLQYGVLFSLVLYVFQYIENVINLPLY